MASQTQTFHLEKLETGESFSTDGQKYTKEDRDTIDRVLNVGAQAHHHTGLSPATINPSIAPSLVQSATGGTLPGSKTVYYEYTWVDAFGFETAPSPIGSQTLPALVATPGSPALSATGGGALIAGPYLYLLTAYTGSSASETPASLASAITTVSTGSIVVTFPVTPAGATGFNVYRFTPGGALFLFVTSVDVSGGSPPTSWTDDGSLAGNFNRFPPTINTTNSTNKVTVTLPSAIPVGYTWNVYRSFSSTIWLSTLLTNPGVASSYVDTGAATLQQNPPTTSNLLGTPAKVLLTDGAEVQGILPISMVGGGVGAGTPFAVTFAFPGTLSSTTGKSVWVSPFDSAVILSAEAALGRSSAPASQQVITDVLKGSGATPTYTSIYSGATPNPKPKIPVGMQIGSSAPPNITTLNLGDSLSCDINQAGGGATPTDHDLTITVYLLVTST